MVRLLFWLVLVVLVAALAWLEAMPRLTAYDDMTSAQKAFYESLEARSFTDDERRDGFDISGEFARLYSYDQTSDEALVQLLLKQGFWIQGGHNTALHVEEDGSYGGILRRAIYLGIKGWFVEGDVLVSLGNEGDGVRKHRFEVQFIPRFAP
ncbi:hypothetical protein [Devosia sp. FKR38]|uniref:hypothetical protein n=1 Tax=Devosia sp. FKR38 TaxID=2562312 RepID=UPI0010C021F9|nr:hypothetical protein [Devosia sp. FKR38]